MWKAERLRDLLIREVICWSFFFYGVLGAVAIVSMFMRKPWILVSVLTVFELFVWISAQKALARWTCAV